MQLSLVVLQVAVLGKSLGGAVAIYLAAARQATMQAVIVENTFTSLEEVAPKVSLCCLAHPWPHSTWTLAPDAEHMQMRMHACSSPAFKRCRAGMKGTHHSSHPPGDGHSMPT